MTDDEIYARCRVEVSRFAVVLVGSSEGNDVMSTVVTRYLASGRSLVDLDDPRAYLMRSVYNEAKSLWRRRGRILPAVTAGADVGDVAQQVATATLVGDALRRLPVQQRAVTFLTYWVGMNSTEIARLLGTRPGTVRRYLHLARETLREVLDDDQ